MGTCPVPTIMVGRMHHSLPLKFLFAIRGDFSIHTKGMATRQTSFRVEPGKAYELDIQRGKAGYTLAGYVVLPSGRVLQ
jgi:hypothetical protein